MAIQFLTSINLNGNELDGAVIQNLATAPATSSFADGQMYFNTTNNNLFTGNNFRQPFCFTQFNHRGYVTFNNTHWINDFHIIG